MTLAGYQIDLVEAGRLWLDGGAMFGIVPRPLWERRIAPDDRNRIPLAHAVPAAARPRPHRPGRHRLGHKADAKFRDIYGVDHEHSTLLGSLAALGVRAGRRDGRRPDAPPLRPRRRRDDASGRRRRSRAHVPRTRTTCVQRRQWEWAHESPREGASFLAENLDPLEASGRLVLLDGDARRSRNVALHVVDGHTQGQQLVRVTDGTSVAAPRRPTWCRRRPTSRSCGSWPTTSSRSRRWPRSRRSWRARRGRAGGSSFEHDPEVASARVGRDRAGVRDRRRERRARRNPRGLDERGGGRYQGPDLSPRRPPVRRPRRPAPCFPRRPPSALPSLGSSS